MSRELLSVTLPNGVIVTVRLSGKVNVRSQFEVSEAVVISNTSQELHISDVMDSLDEAEKLINIEHERYIYIPLTTYTRTVKNNIVRHFIK